MVTRMSVEWLLSLNMSRGDRLPGLFWTRPFSSSPTLVMTAKCSLDCGVNLRSLSRTFRFSSVTFSARLSLSLSDQDGRRLRFLWKQAAELSSSICVASIRWSAVAELARLDKAEESSSPSKPSPSTSFQVGSCTVPSSNWLSAFRHSSFRESSSEESLSNFSLNSSMKASYSSNLWSEACPR